MAQQGIRGRIRGAEDLDVKALEKGPGVEFRFSQLRFDLIENLPSVPAVQFFLDPE
jgi:hypothetical protein